jgi:hypothetical protein
MRLVVSIGTSLICGTAVAAVMDRFVAAHAAAPAFWQGDPVAAAWVAFGGAGGIAVLCYVAFAFIMVMTHAFLDLVTARARLTGADAADGTAPDQRWRDAFAHTDFASMAAQLTPYELAAAPLTLLRLLRAELWRVYATRLLYALAVAIALGGAVAVIEPAPLRALSLPVTAVRWQEAAVVLALVVALATWLAMDHAVGRLARTMTLASAEWTDAVPVAAERVDRRLGLAPPPRPGGAAPDDLVAAVERLVAVLAANPPGAAEAAAAAAMERLDIMLREAAAAERQTLERLAEEVAAQGAAIARHAEVTQASDGDAATLAAAMSQLAAAVERLSEPVLHSMQLLGATDRRLLAVLERQEAVVGSINARWGRLAGALHAMSAGLGNVAQAATAEIAPAQDANELTEELQGLLDDIATDSPASLSQRAS